MSELYQPSSGIEGAIFMASFCDRCQRDAAFRAAVQTDSGLLILTMPPDFAAVHSATGEGS